MAKKTTLNDIGEMLAHVVKSIGAIEQKMATKDDVKEVLGHVVAAQTQINSIEHQLRETKIEVRLGDLEEKVFGAARR